MPKGATFNPFLESFKLVKEDPQMELEQEQEQKSLINELTQGKELANQLKAHLEKTPQTCEFLVEKILSSYEKALSLLNWSDLGVACDPIGSSPKSEISSDLDNSQDQCMKNALKKRKAMPRWSEQVKVCSGTMVEGPLDDGYSWRKYGQKDILGANFPRAYYRCTHRHIQGCLATKQVQRLDEDPSIFKVTYRGRHTCIQASQISKATASAGKESKRAKKEQGVEATQVQEKYFHQVNELECGPIRMERPSDAIFPSFSFPSMPIESPMTVDSPFFTESYQSLGFLSHCQTLQSSDSDLTEIISDPNSFMVDWEFSLDDQVDFGINNFPFDFNIEPELFS